MMMLLKAKHPNIELFLFRWKLAFCTFSINKESCIVLLHNAPHPAIGAYEVLTLSEDSFFRGDIKTIQTSLIRIIFTSSEDYMLY